ncbi:MAG: putative rane protein [Chloroflexi bacterium]|nr:putative rane protein [Chloroflexota bacterium]
MTQSRKWITLAVLVIALAGLAALAIGLPRMDFKPGQIYRLPQESNSVIQMFSMASPEQRRFLTLRGLLTLILIVYPIYILISLLTQRGRKRLARDLAILFLLIVFLLWYNQTGEKFLSGLGKNAVIEPIQQSSEMGDIPLAVFDPSTAHWIPVVLLAGGAVLLAAMVGSIVWWLYTPGPRGGSTSLATPRQKIAAEAEQAVHAIEAGEEVKDVVLRTYYKLERILEEQRGVLRQQAATPSEFAESMGQYGLPKGAINELTHLFEEVRYGEVKTDSAMQRRALTAFNAIIIMLPR